MPTSVVTSGTATTISGYRAGMADLVTRWREYVADSAGSVWTNAEAQTILDGFSTDLYRYQLDVTPMNTGGTTQYRTYRIGYRDLETAASGSPYWQVWDGNGSAIDLGYTVNYQTGVVTFTANQHGSARYLDGHAYDLYGAAAHGWREMAGNKAHLYKFTADGATYDRNQWYEHCMSMAAHYQSLATSPQGSGTNVTLMYRSDLQACWYAPTDHL